MMDSCSPLLGLALLAAGAACEGGEQAPAALPGDAPALAERAAAALVAGDAEGLAALAAPAADVRVEIRQALVETDERETEVLGGAAALRGWAARAAREAGCGDPGACRWPRGVVRQGERRCFGDCCDWGAGPREVAEGALRVQRVCLAARAQGAPRLSYLGLVEAR